MSRLVVHTSQAVLAGAGAAICRRGHVARAFLEDPRATGARCGDCGAKVLVACEECGYRIRGASGPLDRRYERPPFCDGCGSAFPWAGRRERVRHLQNVVDDEPLDPATKLEVQELLEELAGPEPADPERAWARVLTIAPELWTGAARPALAAVVPAAVKDRLGLRA